jgi:hypothetical protein
MKYTTRYIEEGVEREMTTRQSVSSKAVSCVDMYEHMWGEDREECV